MCAIFCTLPVAEEKLAPAAIPIITAEEAEKLNAEALESAKPRLVVASYKQKGYKNVYSTRFTQLWYGTMVKGCDGMLRRTIWNVFLNDDAGCADGHRTIPLHGLQLEVYRLRWRRLHDLDIWRSDSKSDQSDSLRFRHEVNFLSLLHRTFSAWTKGGLLGEYIFRRNLSLNPAEAVWTGNTAEYSLVLKQNLYSKYVHIEEKRFLAEKKWFQMVSGYWT